MNNDPCIDLFDNTRQIKDTDTVKWWKESKSPDSANEYDLDDVEHQKETELEDDTEEWMYLHKNDLTLDNDFIGEVDGQRHVVDIDYNNGTIQNGKRSSTRNFGSSSDQ